MLELNANSIKLDIVNVTFTITLRSSLGDQSGSYVYNFSIPYTPTNAKAFDFPNRLTKFSVVETRVTGSIVADGITLKHGEWFAKTSNERTINIQMYIGAGIFNTIVNELNLPELFDVEFIYSDIVAHIEGNVYKTFPEVNHNFPSIYNPTFYGELEDSPNPDFEHIINDWESDEVHVGTNNNNAISPQLYLGYIIKRIFEYAGYIVTGNVFRDPMFLKAMLYNNFALDKLVPTIFKGEMSIKIPFYVGNVLIWDENIDDGGNHYNILTGKYNVDKEGDYRINIHLTHQPPTLPTTAEEGLLEIYYGSTLIDSVLRPYAFNQHGQFELTHEHNEIILQADIGEDLWCKFMYLDITNNILECRIIQGEIVIQNQDAVDNNIFDNRINYKNHVPDIDTKDFLQSFYSTAKIIPFFDDKFKEVKLVFIDDLITSNKQTNFNNGIFKNTLNRTNNEYKGLNFAYDYQGPDDNLNDNFIDMDQATVKGSFVTFVELPFSLEGTIYFVESLNCYYIWALIDKDTDLYGFVPYSDNQVPVKYDDGLEEISFKIPPMFMRAALVKRALGDKYRNLPSVNAKGSSIGYGLKNDFPLRIMFWHGIEPTDKDKFPIAGTTKLNTEGTQVFEYNWTIENIIPNYFKNFIAWMKKRRKVEFDKEITYADISNFDFEFSANIQGALIMMEEFLAKVSSNKLPRGKFKGWTK